jgi:Zn finger protein HypA/HybF involved in hydrogenase expression
MKKSILIALLAVSLAFTFNACNNSTPKSTAAESTAATKGVYTCTMHPEVRSDKPGDCPKCGMKLVKMETADTTHMYNQSDTTHMK